MDSRKRKGSLGNNMAVRMAVQVLCDDNTYWRLREEMASFIDKLNWDFPVLIQVLCQVEGLSESIKRDDAKELSDYIKDEWSKPEGKK